MCANWKCTVIELVRKMIDENTEECMGMNWGIYIKKV